MKNQKGFTLIEVLIAASVSVFLLAIVATQSVSLVKVQSSTETRSNAVQDSLALASYLVPLIKSAGGGSVQAFMSFFAENNCAARWGMPDCGGSDRLSVVNTPNVPVECSIVAQVSPNTIQINVDGTSTCCLVGKNFNSELMLSSSYTYYSQVYPTNIDPVACTIQYTPGPSAPNDNPVITGSWINGVVSVVSVVTYYWDSTNFQVWQFTDANNNGAMDPGEALKIADNIYDFQVALGYTTGQPPRVSNLGNNADSVLFNSPGEAWGAGPFLSRPYSNLREVMIGIINGSAVRMESQQTVNPLQIFDGPLRSRPGWIFNKITTVVAPKNTGIYD